MSAFLKRRAASLGILHSAMSSAASSSVISTRSWRSPARSRSWASYLPRFLAAIQVSSVWPPAGVGGGGGPGVYGVSGGSPPALKGGAAGVAGGAGGGGVAAKARAFLRGGGGDAGATSDDGPTPETSSVCSATRRTLKRGFAFLEPWRAKLGSAPPEFCSSIFWKRPRSLLKRAFSSAFFRAISRSSSSPHALTASTARCVDAWSTWTSG
mmetsp:Transcript_12888/g.43967  ORF Transcript_12888/g.43967 Transcript_12888/m.43967 type:complete len:211 (+) Transcript_12888:110-742(+)